MSPLELAIKQVADRRWWMLALALTVGCGGEPCPSDCQQLPDGGYAHLVPGSLKPEPCDCSGGK